MRFRGFGFCRLFHAVLSNLSGLVADDDDTPLGAFLRREVLNLKMKLPFRCWFCRFLHGLFLLMGFLLLDGTAELHFSGTSAATVRNGAATFEIFRRL